MNSNTHNQDDDKWQALLAQAEPTFAPEEAPPYGFITRTLARLTAENKERELLERIGMRALFASLLVLLAAAVITLDVQFNNRVDLEPGVISIIQAEYVPIS